MVMADKELIAWLYKLYNTLIKEEGHYAKAVTTGLAIDRLEELVATKESLTEQLAAARRDAEEAEAYAGELEAKLEKAVVAIEKMRVAPDAMMLYIARTTIAEIKGGKDE